MYFFKYIITGFGFGTRFCLTNAVTHSWKSNTVYPILCIYFGVGTVYTALLKFFIVKVSFFDNMKFQFHEYLNISFLVSRLKDPNPNFPIFDYVTFCSSNICSQNFTKVVTNKVRAKLSHHFHFSRVT